MYINTSNAKNAKNYSINLASMIISNNTYYDLLYKEILKLIFLNLHLIESLHPSKWKETSNFERVCWFDWNERKRSFSILFHSKSIFPP